jgi:ABC-type antimicrobial peptide transport system permease subunit
MPGRIWHVEMPGIDRQRNAAEVHTASLPPATSRRAASRSCADATSQRRQEIGIRIALGASHGGVLRLVAGESLRLAAIGAVIGMGLAYAASRAFESLLAGVEPSDPPTYGVAAALTGVMVLSGTVAPALRAPRVDPARALRAE